MSILCFLYGHLVHWTFLIAFKVSHKFGYVVSSFSLNSRKSLISFLISSLTQEWCNCLLFDFPEFVGFLQFVLLLNSNFKAWWFDKRQGVIPIFFVPIEVCYVAEYVVNFIESSMWSWEEGIFFCVSMESSIDVC